MSFEEAYKNYVTYVKNRHKKQGFYNITHDFECRVLPYFKNSDIYEISKFDLIKWQDIILSFNFTNEHALITILYSQNIVIIQTNACCNIYKYSIFTLSLFL